MQKYTRMHISVPGFCCRMVLLLLRFRFPKTHRKTTDQDTAYIRTKTTIYNRGPPRLIELPEEEICI